MGWSSIGRGRSIVFGVFGIAVLGAAGMALVASAGMTTVAGAGTYPASLVTAAGNFESAIGSGGSGFRFDVIQRQTEDARPGGSLVPVVDPNDPTVVTGAASHVYVNSVLARGQVAGGGTFWMEMRLGPPTEGETPNFDTALPMWSVIYHWPTVWRNDGYGWYQTAVSPGVGLDPVTATKMPAALRGLSTLADLGTSTLNGIAVHHYSALVDVANFPGVVASDGALFTETPFPVDLWIDGSNRLVQLEARARNTNQPNYLLKVDTLITFTWLAADPAPQPVPTAQLPLHPNP